MAATTIPGERETVTLRPGERLPPGVYTDIEYIGAGGIRFVRLARMSNPLAAIDKTGKMIPAAPSDPATGEGD